MGYGHWLPNDPRGSGSNEIRKQDLEQLGPIHYGRKQIQPQRSELKSFYKDAEPKLDHPTLWFDDRAREVIGNAVCKIADQRGYTVYALAVLRNHLHTVIRTHRDDSIDMLIELANASHEALLQENLVLKDHPVWSDRTYKVYLRTESHLKSCIRYVQENPVKERLQHQNWDCITNYPINKL